MKVLADTSVWVDFLRRGSKGDAAAIADLADESALVACGPVLAELLAGTPVEEREILRGTIASLPWVGTDHAVWWHVGELGHELRRRGETVSMTDLTIAVAAVRADADLWSFDRAFDRIGDVEPGLRRFDPSGWRR